MNEIGCYMKKIHILLERRRNYDYREYGLTSTQLDILEYLYFNDADKNSLTDIAAFFGVQHTSVLHVLKVLDRKGLICRKDAREGSRCKPILLTLQGRNIVQSHVGDRASLDLLLLAGIPQQNLEILEKSLCQMYQNLLQEQPWTDGIINQNKSKEKTDERKRETEKQHKRQTGNRSPK